jgi:hypothetical protein
VEAAQQGASFQLSVLRTGPPGGRVLGLASLAFKDQFLYLDTAVPAEASLYGLGEASLSGGLRLPRTGKVRAARPPGRVGREAWRGTQ